MIQGLIQKLFGNNGNSKSLAKSRLHFVLVQDRTGLTNEEMNNFKQELVTVIEKYFHLDKEGFDVAYKRESDASTLLINSPVLVKRQQAPKGKIEKRKIKEKADVSSSNKSSKIAEGADAKSAGQTAENL
ncbi:MAG: cell division topological specificity factor MinE [Bdellovibrionales bacterium]|nr:cell division topological specificity factor MinE [Bdellovibrionales bacterium]